MINSINNVAFKGDLNKKQENEKQIASKENSFDKKKIALALAGLATASIAAVTIIKKKTPPDLSFEQFKKKGKFDRGFANFKNKPYTGKITIPQDNGKIILEYSKGNLVESTKYNSSSAATIKKIYSKNNDAQITKIFTFAEGKPVLSNTLTKTNDEIIQEKILPKYPGTFVSKVTQQADGSILFTEQIPKPYTPSKEVLEKCKNIFKNKPEIYRKETINVKTGEVLDSKLIQVKERPLEVARITKDNVTTINGKIYTTKTQEVDGSGNKIITLNYPDLGIVKKITIKPNKERIVDFERPTKS